MSTPEDHLPSDTSGTPHRPEGRCHSAENWGLVRLVFEQAVRLPVAEQEAKVKSLCGANAAAIGEVLELLANGAGGSGGGSDEHLGVGSGLGVKAGDTSSTPSPASSTWSLPSGGGLKHLDSILRERHSDDDEEFFEPPKTIGRYTDIRPLARGGNGMVFSAVQAQPRREVAIKVLRARHVATRAMLRFEREAQVLAHLGHPSIAAIYEVGVESPDAVGGCRRPYIAMELVRGLPITTFCDSRKLSRDERIGLVIQLCRAVAHANTAGVVHRDIKPGNVLVADNVRKKRDAANANEQASPTSTTSAQGRGNAFAGGRESAESRAEARFHSSPATPPSMSSAAWPDCSDRFLVKVLDFGIAKLSQDLCSEDGNGWSAPINTTQEGQLLGTLEYMSPEQASGRTDAATARSDVYSIGLVLYELLSGQQARPVPRENQFAALRLVAEGTIPDLARVSHECAGELAAVVHKAISAVPADRYGTADECALDLVRFLRGEPVAARPRTALAALRSWARNYPRTAAAWAIACAALVGLSVMLARQTSAARSNAAAASANADTASANAATAVRALGALVNRADGQLWQVGTAQAREQELLEAKSLLDSWIAVYPDDLDAREAIAKVYTALYDHSWFVRREEPAHLTTAMRHAERLLAHHAAKGRDIAPPELERFYTKLIVRSGDVAAHQLRFDLSVEPWTLAWKRIVAAVAADPTNAALVEDLCWAEHRLTNAHLCLSNLEESAFHRTALRSAVARLGAMAPNEPGTLWTQVSMEIEAACETHSRHDFEAVMRHRMTALERGVQLCALVPQNREYAYSLVRNCFATAAIISIVKANRIGANRSTADLPPNEPYLEIGRAKRNQLGRTCHADEAYWILWEVDEGSLADSAFAAGDLAGYCRHKLAELRHAKDRLVFFPASTDALLCVMEREEELANAEARILPLNTGCNRVE